jgi:hypothetical protein
MVFKFVQIKGNTSLLLLDNAKYINQNQVTNVSVTVILKSLFKWEADAH